jgi:NitT/TauT family transport system substrate-binding protein
METIGAQFQYLSPSSNLAQVPYNGLFTKRENTRANRQEAVGVARGLAKGTIFMLANPEMAIKIHWQQYPQTKPQGVDETTALKGALHIVESRLDKMRLDQAKAQKWGAYEESEWQTYARLLDLDSARINWSRVYTNELIDEVNRFDAASIEAQAKGMTVAPSGS